MRSENRSLFQMRPGMRLAVFIALTGISMIIGAMISFSIVAAYLHVGFAGIQHALLAPENAHIALFANALASIIAFLLPGIAAAYFTEGSLLVNMGFAPVKHPKLIQWVVLIAFTGFLLSGALASLTEKISIPVNFKNWAEGLEVTYKKALMAMTQMHSVGDLLINLLAVAIIPACVEELYFRGALQKNLKDWSGKPMIAIVVTAIVFSAFHFSYYGFLSRMALGIVLGLIFEYTGSIWLAILLHAINNGVAVIALYTVKGNPDKVDKVMDENLPMYWGVVAIVLLIILFKNLIKDADYGRLEKSI